MSLAAAGRLDYSTPLRWHARLRDEPAELPWGVSYDLVLNSVEFEGITIRTTGGMRLSYSPHGDSLQLRALHAGDEISFVAQAIHILTDGNSLEISCFLDCSRTVSTKDSVPAQPPNHQQEN